MTQGKRRLLMWSIVAVIAVCVAYANSFDNAFHFDDFHTVVDNPAIRSLANIPHFFSDASTFSVLPANRTYRPVVSASLALDYALGRGYVPLWFHVSTFLCFLLLLWCLFLLYERVLQSVSGRADDKYSASVAFVALAAAAWFGLHPVMAETVNYVIQRGDIDCTLGCVAALVVYARFPGLRKTSLYLLPLVFGLLSKPPAAVFPALLFFYVYFFEAEGRRDRLKVSGIAALPSLGVTAALMILQSAMTPKSFAPGILPAWDYRLTQPYVWLRYFGELFLPVHLNVDSDLGPFDHFNLRALAGVMFVLALGVAIAWTARRRVLYPIAYGLIWFAVTQLPTSLYPLSEVENDHRMLFSFAGLILAVAWAARMLLVRWQPRPWPARWKQALVGCLVLGLSGYAWGVHERNRVWHTEESLWLDDVEKSPQNGRGLMIYGLTLMNKGEYPEALDYFDRALLYTPAYPTLEINLGVVNGAMNRQSEAEQHFLRAIALAPNDDLTHAYYGRWLNERGRTAEALGQLKTAVTLNPSRPMQQDLLLTVLSRSGDDGALRQAAVDTLKAIPGDATAENLLQHPPVQDADFWVNRSLALNQAGKYADSIAAAQRALQLDPNSAFAWNNIAANYESMQQWDSAIEAARKAVALKPDFQLAKNNLAWSEAQKKLGVREKRP